MKVISEIKSMQEISEYHRCSGKAIGFVPTMGFLHKGHTSLIDKARQENDVVVISIYVNPTQFLKGEDLSKYPRDFERDYIMCEKAGADYIFYPGDGEMYKDKHYTSVVVSDITEKLEGKFRPGHFTGVATVVLKLFNAVKPHRAYFGQKDAQQVIVIKKMVDDLNYDTEIITGETIREDSGLAMSSRNSYLSAEYRSQAAEISLALCEAKKLILSGRVYNVKEVWEYIVRYISTQAPKGEIQYVAITDNLQLNDIKDIRAYTGEVLISTAVKFGSTRLIDNILFIKN
jgi:pantoate--beta-alanine ligase